MPFIRPREFLLFLVCWVFLLPEDVGFCQMPFLWEMKLLDLISSLYNRALVCKTKLSFWPPPSKGLGLFHFPFWALWLPAWSSLAQGELPQMLAIVLREQLMTGCSPVSLRNGLWNVLPCLLCTPSPCLLGGVILSKRCWMSWLRAVDIVQTLAVL